MEKPLGIISSIITITGFVFALSQVGELRDLGFDVSTDVKAITGSWFFALILVLAIATTFGYGFGYLVAYFEKILGRISIIVAIPTSGIISGFQTGVVTLLIAKLFQIEGGLGMILAISYVLSGMVETLFVYRHFARFFPINDNGSPKNCDSAATVNFVFFLVGGLAFAADSNIVTDGLGYFLLILFGSIIGMATLASGYGLYILTKDDDGVVEHP